MDNNFYEEEENDEILDPAPSTKQTAYEQLLQRHTIPFDTLKQNVLNAIKNAQFKRSHLESQLVLCFSLSIFLNIYSF